METLCLGRHLVGVSRIALGCMRMASHLLQEASQVLETARQEMSLKKSLTIYFHKKLIQPRY